MDGVGAVFPDADSFVFNVEAGGGEVCGGGDGGALGVRVGKGVRGSGEGGRRGEGGGGRWKGGVFTYEIYLSY